MKKLMTFLLISIAFAGRISAQATTAETEASQIAQKMKDSLSLSDQQKSQIESASIGLQSLKINLRQVYNGKALELYLLMAEDNRDTLYKNLLPPDKYLLYRQKRTNLFSSN